MSWGGIRLANLGAEVHESHQACRLGSASVASALWLLLGYAVDSATEGKDISCINEFNRTARIGPCQDAGGSVISFWIVKCAQDHYIVDDVVVDVGIVYPAFVILECCRSRYISTLSRGWPCASTEFSRTWRSRLVTSWSGCSGLS